MLGSLLFSSACTPELITPETGDTADTATTFVWDDLDNSWPKAEPPADLVGEGFSTGQVIPNIQLVDQYDDTVALWQFYGDVIFLDISTMWCAPCQDLGEDTQETYEDYQDEGFMYATVLQENMSGETPAVTDLEMWANSYGINAPILSDEFGVTNSATSQGTYPSLLVIGRDLMVVQDNVYPPTDASVRQAIEDAL